MIDYLELVLAAQEQDEWDGKQTDKETVRIPLAQHAAKQVRTAWREPADAPIRQGISEPKIITAPFMAEPLVQSQKTNRNALSDIDFLSPIRSSALLFSEGYLMRDRSRSWARSAYRESVLTAQAAASLQQGGGKAVTVSVPDTVTPTPSVSTLDNAFARDARRYDNGFSMY